MTLARRVVFSFITLVLGAALAIGIAELGLRLFMPQKTGPVQLVYHPLVGSMPVPNQRGRVTLPGVYTYTFTNDAQGFRVTGKTDRERAAARVLAIGDSFTYGFGVSDDQTFSFLLENKLSTEQRPTAVINAGNGGKGTDYALRFFETIGRGLRPDVTMLFFFPNDFRDNARNRLYRVAEDGTLTSRGKSTVWSTSRYRESALYNWAISSSHLANLLRRTAVILLARQGQESDQDGSDLVVTYRGKKLDYATAANTRLTGIYLERFVAAVRDARSSLLIFYIPTADEVQQFRATGQRSKDEQAFAGLVRQQGVSYVSFAPVMAGSAKPLEALYYDEERLGRPSGHWTPLGHAIAAEFMAPLVKASLDLRPTH